MAGSIDAMVVLGLAGKAQEVFVQQGTYLSFPLAPIGMNQKRMELLIDDPLSPEGQRGLADFSLIVNEIPHEAIWQPSGDSRLWDVYGDVLGGAELAEATHTPQEESGYRKAFTLLFQQQADGMLSDSPQVRLYQQYRDAYIVSVQEYNNRKGQAELSSDPVVRDAWARDEPLLKQRVAEIEQNWVVAGKRNEIDEARRVLVAYSSRSPSTVWAEYRKRFDPALPEIYFRSTPEGSMYVPTSYIPSDVVRGSWPTISLTREDLSRLAGAAAPALRSRLAGGAADDSLQYVSFEYSSVGVSRPWYVSEAFLSRAWRFYDHAQVLSDGATPASGRCSAYVSGLVLARNITTVHRKTTTQASDLAFLPTARTATPVLVARPYPAADLEAKVAAREAVAARADVGKIQTVAPASARVAAGGIGERKEPIRSMPRVARVSDENGSAGVMPVAKATAMERPIQLVKFQRLALSPVGSPRMPPPPPPPPQSPTTTFTTGPEDVYVLAFICRLLPKSPDPDPGLTWS
jgi:hypothetical protein